MLEEVKKDFCYGCSACASVCPKYAIKMLPDEEGFKYPNINKEQCIECGLCEKVCPVLKYEDKKNHSIRNVYGVKHKDIDVLNTSSSGGFFYSNF